MASTTSPAPTGYVSVIDLDGPLTELGRCVLDLTVHAYGGSATYNTAGQLVVKLTADQAARRTADLARELYG
jgi:hypothetical protein